MALHKDTIPPAPEQYILSFVPETVGRLFEPLLLERAGNLAVASFTDGGQKVRGWSPHPKSREVWKALIDKRAIGLITSLGMVKSCDVRDRTARLWTLATDLSMDAAHRSLPQAVFVDRTKMGIAHEEHLRRTRRGRYDMFPADQSSVVLSAPFPEEIEGTVHWPGATAFEDWFVRVEASATPPETPNDL